ncbi:hypothetical protein [Aegicerativicinus sediminis]|uniref:hypothetical protein n=1 Tax=Aegicerativicinus sediminis TaxID=2893202 RepID=UPI001E4CD4E1|nr:hypothetical protein [Aegicerativicinus sediminis]
MKKMQLITSLLLIAFLFTGFIIRYKSTVPKVFTEANLESHMLPLADASVKISHVPDSQYYKLKETKIYKTYPLYLPGREPEGYYEQLKGLNPEIAFDQNQLKTEQDWIKAGELVYEWGLDVDPFDSLQLQDYQHDFEKFNMPVTKDGIVPFFKVVIREKGKLEITGRSCNTCHTKVMPDGGILKGGQGNYPFDQSFGNSIRSALINPSVPDTMKTHIGQRFSGNLFGAYWMESPAQQRMRIISNDDFIATLENTYGGVMHRHGTVLGSPTSIPDLYNLKERKYLDHTGLVQNKGLVDIMLYATLNEEADRMDKYNGTTVIRRWPSEDKSIYQRFSRFSDAQLYALAQFLTSLEAPKSPEKFSEDELKQGERLFAEQGCVSCHTPPLYTNNALTPVDGFEVPKEHKAKYNVFDISVGTDPTLALESRRGTGYYKIPSLIGVWNRQALLHNGSIRSLEELLNAARLKDDYQPKGFFPAWKKVGPVLGHPFGLDLAENDKKALISYLKSL